MPEKTKLILASQSPRRMELIKKLGLDFIVRPSLFDESTIPQINPVQFASDAALAKASEVFQRLETSEYDGIVIGVDTIVVLDDQILIKPIDEEDAFNILSQLSGRTHCVISAVAIVSDAQSPIQFHEKTNVTFRELRENEIRAYIKTGSPMDKAGAYGIQDEGRDFVKKFEGDFYNVMGLPVDKLSTELSGLIKLPD